MTTCEILILTANPRRDLELGREMRAIKWSLKKGRYGQYAKIDWAPEAQPDDLLDTLEQQTASIFHFAGHGGTSRRTDVVTRDVSPRQPSQGQIELGDEDGHPSFVDEHALANHFKHFKGQIRLVVLNACATGPLVEAVREHIDCVIGTDRKIGDRAAIVFAKRFYKTLADGKSVKEAFDVACLRLESEGIRAGELMILRGRSGIDPAQMVLIGPDIARGVGASLSRSDEKASNLLRRYWMLAPVAVSIALAATAGRLLLPKVPDKPGEVLHKPPAATLGQSLPAKVPDKPGEVLQNHAPVVTGVELSVFDRLETADTLMVEEAVYVKGGPVPGRNARADYLIKIVDHKDLDHSFPNLSASDRSTVQWIIERLVSEEFIVSENATPTGLEKSVMRRRFRIMPESAPASPRVLRGDVRDKLKANLVAADAAMSWATKNSTGHDLDNATRTNNLRLYVDAPTRNRFLAIYKSLTGKDKPNSEDLAEIDKLVLEIVGNAAAPTATNPAPKLGAHITSEMLGKIKQKIEDYKPTGIREYLAHHPAGSRVVSPHQTRDILREYVTSVGPQSSFSRSMALLGLDTAKWGELEKDEVFDLVDQIVVDSHGYNRGVAINIGLNGLDPKVFAGIPRLTSCEKDARDLAEMARGLGFEVRPPLLTAQATREAARRAIRSIAKELKAGDLFVLSYSGFITPRGGLMKGAPTDLEQDILFYDGAMPDSELIELLAEFAPGVNIVLVVDSSHAAIFDQKEFANVTRRKGLDPRPGILLLAACGEDQIASDLSQNGLFTGALLKIIKGRPNVGNYRTLATAVRDEVMKASSNLQTPQMNLIGEEAEDMALRGAFRLK